MMAVRAEDSGDGSFRSVFEQSHIPMTLVDSDALVKAGAHTRAQLVALVLGEGLASE